MLRVFTFATVCGLALALAGRIAAQQPHQHDPKTHQHPEAQKIKNPIPTSPQSIETGKKIYEEFCAECHGDEGKGDGMMASHIEVKPADFTDATWKHGATDGEIFVVIRDGTKDGMESFSKKLKPDQMWHVINYIRTLGPKPTKSH